MPTFIYGTKDVYLIWVRSSPLVPVLFYPKLFEPSQFFRKIKGFQGMGIIWDEKFNTWELWQASGLI